MFLLTSRFRANHNAHDQLYSEAPIANGAFSFVKDALRRVTYAQ